MATKKAPRPRRKKQRLVPHTTDKGRSVIFFERAVYPLRDAPPLELAKAWEKLATIKTLPEHHWEELGPANIAGRVTSLVMHPTRKGWMFAGTAGGGVWRTQNGGDSWDPCWDKNFTHNIGALSIYSSPKLTRLLAATGEANLSADTYSGTGIYMSDDSGDTWKSFFTQPGGGAHSIESILKMVPGRIGSVAQDPFEILHGAVGSVTLDERMPAGLYLLDIEKGLVPCEAFPMRSYNCHSVAFHHRRKGWLFAALELRGSLNGVWRSKDSGKSWEHLTNGLPPGEEFGRTTLALAPSNNNIIYALAANRDRRLLGVFRSSNGGDTWRQIINRKYPDETSLSYNNTIAVHPKDPDFVVWGGQCLYATRNAGERWDKITVQAPLFRQASTRNYVHEDHHALIITPAGEIYSGNDGGVAYSKDSGRTWEKKSEGMVTSMFYDVDVAPTNGKIMGGGCQDNGTLIMGLGIDARGKPAGPRHAIQPLYGDGGWIVFDGGNAENVYASYHNVNVHHHSPGNNWGPFGWPSVEPEEMAKEERSQRAIAVLAIEPGTREGGRPKQLWAGTHRLWRTRDEGITWKVASPTFDGSVISAIEIASFNTSIMFVGTTKGGIYRSRNGGKKWTENLAGIDIPRRLISRIETHPLRPSTVAVTVASTGLHGAVLKNEARRQFEDASQAREVKQPFRKTYSNVFLSEDAGQTWEDIDEGRLPNVVFYALAYETRYPYRLFTAGDAGVFVREDEDWIPIRGNMPNVVVSDLVYHHEDQTLTAATYGRGIWQLDVSKLNSGLPGYGTFKQMIAGHEEEWRLSKLPRPSALVP